MWVFTVTNVTPKFGVGWDDGRIEPQLIYSADGIAWKRLPVREPFIPCGPAGSFEAGSVYSAGNRPVAIGDEVRFYYFGVSYTHGSTEPVNSPSNYSGFGMATLGRDRYVAWQGRAVPCTLRTKALKFSGRRLHLNLDASRGEARVALLDAEGRPLPGFSLGDCRSISADSFDHVVTWGDNSDLAALAGKEIQVEFSLRQAALYTWQFK